MKIRHGRTVIILSLALLAACERQSDKRISGDTPYDVAQSIYILAMDLPPDKREEFSTAIASLQLLVTDRQLQTAQTTVTPQLAQMVRGRTPYEVIQLAAVYRGSFPRFSPNETRRSRRNQPAPDATTSTKDVAGTIASADDN